MATKKNEEMMPEFNSPFESAINPDDMFLDFSDVEAAEFTPVPAGWYKVEVTDATDRQIKNEGGKIPMGTLGTQWELTVIEGEYENRKFWDSHWHHRVSAPFMKTFLTKAGFTEEDFSGPMSYDNIREKVVGSQLWARVTIRKSEEYGDSNNIKGYAKLDERNSPKQGSANSLMP